MNRELREASVDWNAAGGSFDDLVRWYRRHRRDLPWRHSHDPYPILVSEIMLQQTRVETVIPYYLRFLARFPNPEELASADLEEVYRLWAGLGYYRRARNLQLCAQEVAKRGSFPDTFEELKGLPGVGEYTAAAVASIAFGQPAVALDGNALRVLARYFGLPEDPMLTSSRRQLTDWTLPQIPLGAAGDFTQAVMELGARVCLPRTPICISCPLQSGCVARALNKTGEIPATRPRPANQAVGWVAFCIHHDGRVMLHRDHQSRFLKGLWTPPWGPAENRDELLVEWQSRFPGTSPERVGLVKHQITVHKLSVEVWRWQCWNRPTDYADWREPSDSGLPRLTSKILQLR